MRTNVTPLFGTHSAMEAVSTQSAACIQELTEVFAQIYGTARDQVLDHASFNKAAEVLKNHTGLNVVFDLTTDYGPAVIPPSVDRNNVLVNAMDKNFISSSDGLRMIEQAGGFLRGNVNLRLGRVGGIFSEIVNKIMLPVSMFTKSVSGLGKFDLTPRELAAAVLHECGHIFCYFEFISRTVTTNQVLAGMSKALDGVSTQIEREAVFITVKKRMNLRDLDVAELSKTNKSKVADVIVVSNIVKEARAELGSNIYDMTSWEALSDQFANRFQAGRDLVTALDKIHRSQFNISNRHISVFLAVEALKITLLFIALPVAMMMVLFDTPDRSYDTPKDRFRRIRNDLVEQLKNKELPKETVARMQEDIATIDAVMAPMEDRRQWFGVLAEQWPSLRKQRNQKLLQQELEALAVNELFEKAAHLRTLA